jgi:hypothetical protein
VRVPSPAAQSQIVNTSDQVVSLVDALTLQASDATRRSIALRAAILSAAFSGKLTSKEAISV